MKHHIIVKYNEKVTDKTALYEEIAALFERAKTIQGVRDVALYPSVTVLPNRYDLMILLTLADDALEHWNQSELHARWKRDYGQYIASKAIFDSI